VTDPAPRSDFALGLLLGLVVGAMIVLLLR